MNITLNQAISLLNEASAITVNIDGYPAVLYPRLIQDEDEALFMDFEWGNDEGLIWFFGFNREENQEVELIGSSLFLKEQEEDEKVEITLMKLWDVEGEIKNGAFMLEEDEDIDDEKNEIDFTHTPGD